MKATLIKLSMSVDPRLLKLVVMALALALPYIINYPGMPGDITT
jgi:hypothetical protein